MNKWMLFAALSFSSITHGNEALSVETPLPSNLQLAFPNESNIQPEESPFVVESVVPMSNELGERWAVVTLRNSVSGRRTLNHKHLMALVADGTRLHPEPFTQSFLANESLSIVVNFGLRKFPLLDVYSREE